MVQLPRLEKAVFCVMPVAGQPVQPKSMLILASSSEWRQKLLTEAGFIFKVIPTDFDEEPHQKSITNP